MEYTDIGFRVASLSERYINAKGIIDKTILTCLD